MRTFASAALLVATVSAVAAAQAPRMAPATIDPGMTKAQVIEKLGKPLSERTTGSWTYLYYRNGQEKQFGMSDLVTMEGEKVVDAIFRSPQRRYSGASSSPAPVPTAVAIARGRAALDTTKKASPAQTRKP